MRKKFTLLSVCALSVALVFMIGLAIDAQWITHLDDFFMKNRLVNYSFLTIFTGGVAKIATIGPMVIIVSFFAFFLWRKQYRALALWCLANLMFVSGFGYLLKQVFQRTRPEQVQYLARSSYSFPSGHSLLVMTLISSVCLIYFFTSKKMPKLVKGGLLLLLLVIAGGRIYLGVHFISDVIAGLSLGLGLTFGSGSLFYSYLQPTDTKLKDVKDMKLVKWQRVLLSLLACLVVLITGLSIFALKVYRSSQNAADSMYAPIERSGKVKTPEASEPMSILILGIANDAKRKTDFRANTIMVATLNNQTKETTLVSIPRDAFVEIVGADYQDKINHAHSIGGPEMIIDTVEKFLAIPIHHYMEVNMDGLQTLVDAVGGVTVDNDFAFSAEGIDYPKGKQHLDGWEALQYSRMRYEDPTGDYGRQGRQREVLEVLINQLVSTKSLFNYQKILAGIGENGKTDLTFNQMQKILTDYHSSLRKINSQQVQGVGFTGDGVTGQAGISYQEIPQAEVERVKKILFKQLDL